LNTTRRYVPDSQIKVSYFTSKGYTTTAYVDEETLDGTNKHSDVPVSLDLILGLDGTWSYVDFDMREWDFNPYTGEFTERNA
jgi:hypothetical protein